MEERRELERKIEQASRIASRIDDPTTYQRLRNFIEELRQRLRQRPCGFGLHGLDGCKFHALVIQHHGTAIPEVEIVSSHALFPRLALP
jgi:hypothetical protein